VDRRHRVTRKAERNPRVLHVPHELPITFQTICAFRIRPLEDIAGRPCLAGLSSIPSVLPIHNDTGYIRSKDANTDFDTPPFSLPWQPLTSDSFKWCASVQGLPSSH